MAVNPSAPAADPVYDQVRTLATSGEVAAGTWLREATAGGDMPGLSELNAAFHGIFLERCGNRHVATAPQTVMRPAVVTHTFRQYSADALRRSMQHHAELVAAASASAR